jgi:hypothetical protein
MDVAAYRAKLASPALLIIMRAPAIARSAAPSRFIIDSVAYLQNACAIAIEHRLR